MKLTLPFVVLITSLMLFTACKKTKHGCVDSNANNYNEFAEIDNNSCCFNCYDEAESFIGEYCGNEVSEITENGIVYENVHVWILNGEYVLPGTPGAIPFYSPDMPPLIVSVWNSEVTCY
tara:strand:- start:442 stop:801 length:360 start_codon:yes stop_codon:yes gene_type:complete